jgi:uncharacterized protein (TIGR02466 family)
MNDDIKITRTDLWATPIWQYYISDDVVNFKKIISEVYEIKQSQESRIVSNNGGWQSNFVDSKDTELSKLMDYVINNIKKCYDDLSIKKKYYNIQTTYWININSFSHKNLKHIHPNSILSGCIYLKVPKNSGNIIFHPNLANEYFFQSFTNCNNDITSYQTTFFPEEKKVIIFPAFLPHSVGINNSNEDRISIAFNAFFYDQE